MNHSESNFTHHTRAIQVTLRTKRQQEGNVQLIETHGVTILLLIPPTANVLIRLLSKYFNPLSHSQDSGADDDDSLLDK